MVSGSTLPEDLIRDILLRLPVRSLLRFKAVHKHWCALITSSDFVDTHCRHLTNPKYTVVLTTRDSQTSTRTHRRPYLCSISVLRDGTNRVDDRIMPFSLDEKPCNMGIMGCSNGLLCLRRMSWRGNLQCIEYILWNPATGQYRHLPPLLKSSFISLDGMGFGFHHRTKDYKLLQFKGKDATGRGHVAEVYTLSTDSWREVKGIPEFWLFISKPVIFKGVWYIMVVKLDERPRVLSFDMGDETFSMMKAALPYYGRHVEMKLMVYKQLLAMCRNRGGRQYHTKPTYKFEIWVMKEECWTRVFKCCALPLSMTGDVKGPLGPWNDEEIITMEREKSSDRLLEISQGNLDKLRSLRVHDMSLCLFNPLTQQSKKLPVDNALCFQEAHGYVESMVSVYFTKHQDRDGREYQTIDSI